MITPIYDAGTRVRLYNGETATVVLSNSCRLRLKPDRAIERRFTDRDGTEHIIHERRERDVAPDVDLTVIEEQP